MRDSAEIQHAMQFFFVINADDSNNLVWCLKPLCCRVALFQDTAALPVAIPNRDERAAIGIGFAFAPLDSRLWVSGLWSLHAERPALLRFEKSLVTRFEGQPIMP